MTNLAIQMGARIRTARQTKAFSQEELARLIDVRTRTLSRWENGYSTPRLRHIRRLAEVLDVPLAWLLEGDGEPDGNDHTTTEVAA